MSDEAKTNLVSDIAGAMSGIEGSKKDEITRRQLGHWAKVDTDFGARVSSALGSLCNA